MIDFLRFLAFDPLSCCPVFAALVAGIILFWFISHSETMSEANDGNRKHLPIPQGSYPVGCIDLMTEHSVKGSFMRLYYPAQDGVMNRSMQWPLWLPSKHYLDGYAYFLHIWAPLFKTIFKFCIGDVYIPAVWNAPPIRGMKFPLIIFSHGLGGCRTSYSVTCTELASRGFIVAAVEHRDRSACLTFYLRQMNPTCNTGDEAYESLTSSVEDVTSIFIPDYLPYQRLGKQQSHYSIRNKQVHQRAKECSKALDVLVAINKGEFVTNVLDPNYSGAMFESIMDVSRVAAVGHSFGGASIIQCLANDPRFCVGVAMDAWMFPLKDEIHCFEDTKQPILFINTEAFRTNKNTEVLLQLQSNVVERRMLTIKGSIHQNQSDSPFICGNIIRRLLKAHSPLNHVTVMDINNKLIMQFLWKYLDVPPNKECDNFLDNHQHHLVEGASLDSHL